RFESRSPSGPERMDLFARPGKLLRRERRKNRAKRRRPVENEARLLALAEREFPDRAKILSARRNVRIEQHSVRARDELETPILLLRHPGHDGAVVEAHDEFGPNGDFALNAADD